MKIAHLILAHTATEQLERLINRLKHEDAHFFIHVDKKSDIRPFEKLEVMPNVRLVCNRVKVFWGGFSQVQATLNGMKEIMGSGTKFDYINLMSGMDYPIKSTRFIHDFLQDNPGNIYMRCEPIMEQWKEAATRITGYHLANINFPGKYKVERALNRLMPPRTLRNAMTAVGRSQWFTISGESVAYILEYVKANPWITRFFKLSWGADEIFFHTILYNSPYRQAIQSDNLTYTDWSRGGASPKLLAADDIKALLQTDKLFARKFDQQKEGFILDTLDNIHNSGRKIALKKYQRSLAV